MKLRINPLDFIGVTLSSIACIAALVLVLRRPEPRQPVELPHEDRTLSHLNAGMDAALLRIAALESLRASEAELDKSGIEVETESTRDSSGPEADSAWYASVEQRLARLESMCNSARTAGLFPAELLDADDAQIAKAKIGYQAVFLDAGKPEAERMEALHLLRQFPEEMRAIDDAIVSECIRLLDPANEFGAKNRLLLEVSDLRSPRLLPAFLDCVRTSEDPRTIQRGMEGLRHLPPSSESIAAIETVIRTSRDEETIREAKRVLEDMLEVKRK